jgi:hypoxanthine phosphoribosyltransferase
VSFPRPRPAVLYSEDQIARRIEEVGAEIARGASGAEVCVVVLMKSCLVFMADLIRAIPGELSVHLLRVQEQEEAGTEPPRTEFIYSMPIAYEGRDILLLDDIVDTGVTLTYVLSHIREHGPKSLRVCALIDKPRERKVDLQPDFALFRLEDPPADRFLVGYGLDFEEAYRGLPYIGTIPRPSASGPEGVS